MAEFTLVIESRALGGSVADRILEKEVDWPIVPQMGEQVDLEGNASRVIEVTHTASTGKAYVNIPVADEEFDRIASLEGYKRIL